MNGDPSRVVINENKISFSCSETFESCILTIKRTCIYFFFLAVRHSTAIKFVLPE